MAGIGATGRLNNDLFGYSLNYISRLVVSKNLDHFCEINSVADEPFVLIQDENVDNQISLPRRHLKRDDNRTFVPIDD